MNNIDTCVTKDLGITLPFLMSCVLPCRGMPAILKLAQFEAVKNIYCLSMQPKEKDIRNMRVRHKFRHKEVN